ncbi:deoxynucleoside kinase [Cytobacillus kochii]|uniref:Deoxynucleoside kinase n=1 Tax=Cytobacillus kochii TaxID=859143 RepID=A0A248THQ6_9BACI|nr:deoxynucleoside kinase [Cytobacillus kochii]ASV67747.1 deoxynucleoside kinase [Cytobacillus kochii]
MNQVPFITVEGPIGVGKTTLATALSTHFNYHLLKEIVDENPFLGKFYENIDEWSFQTEMFFLCNRYKQLKDIKDRYILNDMPVVADYHIFKNLIFASKSLEAPEYKKYEQIYHILTDDMPRPNIIIYLRASLDTLLKRIEKRGREIEKNISPLYLEQLSIDYDLKMQAFEKQHPDIPILHLDGDQLDFVHNKNDLQYIIDMVTTSIQTRSTKA